ncbi:hypothetical protein BE20_18925 [Sorangium cellulosum]|uniref:Secreted protein n=1 Tax=Sorangium cellulosum TaxID=56 RepID=A0A150SD11_SORCE|nr:hypothetical protein BE18_18090 [Sorangium cellulosum]KYF90028.1 hypothetical protein BE20_18925 [Sorangium cellulosum]
MRFQKVVCVLGVSALTGAAAAAGCGGDDGGATSSNSGATGGATVRDCSQKHPVCTAVASDCVAVHDNRDATTFGLRMAQLTITKPDVLAIGYVARLVAQGLTITLPQCNLNGTGTFSWLLEFDKANGKLRTGGARIADDPLEGYCFANMSVGEFEIAPTEIDAPLGDDGAWSGEAETLNVPIFLETSPDPIILPMHQVRLTDATLSADNNCIGRYNVKGLDPMNACLPGQDGDPPAFINGGKLAAFITLEEVDRVIVPDVKQSLCVVLSGDIVKYGAGGEPNTCKRDESGQIVLKGDWCSATNSPATDDCADAYALGGEFAASAVKINGLCQQ